MANQHSISRLLISTASNLRLVDTDLPVGTPFGSWITSGPSFCLHRRGHANHYCVCECRCGVFMVCALQHLRSGRSASCGCEVHRSPIGRGTAARNKLLHGVWKGMIARCENQINDHFEFYGARGISVCQEWRLNFRAFVTWAKEHGYRRGLEIDRKDNNGNYEPNNCRWVTGSINCRNTRRNHLLTAFGETKSVLEWSEDTRCVIEYYTLRSRIHTGHWNPEDAITTPKLHNRGRQSTKPYRRKSEADETTRA